MATVPTATLAVTDEIMATPAYLREHPKDWSLTVTRKENGLIQYTITRILPERRYLVAHFAAKHAGKYIATSDTPSFGNKGRNTFYLSISPENTKESTFELSESYLAMKTDDQEVDIPMPGGARYRFRLSDFAPEDLRDSKLKD
jgi:hypothetical protein